MDKGQKGKELVPRNSGGIDDFVLDKDIFSNIFDKDIRRVYIYKKAERLAKALQAILPAFAASTALRERIDSIGFALVDAALLPPARAREQLSRELLALSSMLAIIRTGSLLSPMNADLIARETNLLLQEVALYEEPRLTMEESPTLATIARSTQKQPPMRRTPSKGHIGHLSDTSNAPHIPAKNTDRREAILAVVRSKQQVYIKDVSTMVRGVSEKTVQRELQALVKEGVLTKSGERRWTLYSLA